jgi:predicted NACHT family NTPase
MILGKPGAGKTTFLKHLAIQCIGGKFQGERVPVFITLKDFAEADDKPDFLGYITRLVPHNVEIPPTPLKKGGYKEDLRKRGNEEEELVPPFSRGARGDLRQILNAGRALVLLDGLDEVRDADSSRVLRQIREDCLNSDCYVSREVRQEIEETLLLPIAEIEKRQQRVL